MAHILGDVKGTKKRHCFFLLILCYSRTKMIFFLFLAGLYFRKIRDLQAGHTEKGRNCGNFCSEKKTPNVHPLSTVSSATLNTVYLGQPQTLVRQLKTTKSQSGVKLCPWISVN